MEGRKKSPICTLLIGLEAVHTETAKDKLLDNSSKMYINVQCNKQLELYSLRPSLPPSLPPSLRPSVHNVSPSDGGEEPKRPENKHL